jgi:hypothetical protein
VQLKNINMKQLLSLFLFLLPCLALAQYPTNGNQKITLGEQTTADGLIWRGVLADTGIITPSSDTSAYIILDTVNHRFYNYNRATNVWSATTIGSISSGLTGVLPVANGGTGSATQNFVDLTTTQSSIGGAKTFTSAVTGARFNPTATTVTGNGMYLPSTNALGFSTNSINRIIIDNVGNLMYGGRNVIEASQGLATDGTAPTLQISKNDTATNSNDKIADIRLVNANSFNSGAIGRIVALNPLNPTIEKRVAQISFFQDSLNTGGFTFNVLNLGTLTRSMLFKSNGNIAIARPSDLIATARLHIGQGTATASTAPLKFTSQGASLLNPVEGGAVEFNGTNLLFTPSTTRHTVNHGLTGSATLDFASTNAQNSRDMTIAVTGAADGDVVSLGVPNAAVNANTSYSAWVSAAGTVTVRFNNYSSGTVDPASGSFKVFVTK